MSFAKFETGLKRLNQVLKPGGWLALYNQHFRLADTELASRYWTDAFRFSAGYALTLLYGSDNLRIDGAYKTKALYRKNADVCSKEY